MEGEFCVETRNPLISAEELAANLEDSELRVVDCRFDLLEPAAGRISYQQGHIPGAVFADLDDDLAGPIKAGTGRHPLPDPGVLAETFGELGIGPETRVVVYDDCSGALAARTWWLLHWLGFDRTFLLDGGLQRWTALSLPTQQGNVTVSPQSFQAVPRNELVTETGDFADSVKGGRPLRLVDARDAARFRGEREPIDIVAGHIPGALNLPFTESLESDGTWKPKDDIEELWSGLLGDRQEEPWSVMCGSGVTACHLVISSLIAGLPEPRVYVGSWSEWIADPQRPVATGES